MFVTLEEIAAKIPDGAKLAVPADYAGIAMAATRALIRRGVKDLHIVGVPTSGFQSELLIAAGCVKTYESSALTLGEHNPPYCFNNAIKEGTIHIVDATCPAIHAALQASQKGAPFATLRGIIGSDIVNHHPDWKVIQNPFSDSNDPVVAIPAIQPDVSLFHAPLADREGNIWVGRRRELINMAQASKTALVTVEEISETNLLEDETTAAGTLPALYVGGIAHVSKGSWPLGFWQGDGEDSDHLRLFKDMSRNDSTLQEYLAEYVFGSGSAS
ncbi:CoA synthetase [Sneathiella sp. P13V-1]|uniref:CoA transferase subunit A n=1 Tax=Sneathiella sp. P13V-1 TaxID=2697366 RepID=UPI00187B7A1C|nr:CoA-transferase [Sneathiella sp. P13V-1]MBE7635392.1 CoA synthetase [Sneathiella sp. P13V-1]